MEKFKICLIPNTMFSWNGGKDFVFYLLSGLVQSDIKVKLELSIIGTRNDKTILNEFIDQFKIEFTEVDGVSKDGVYQIVKDKRIDVIFSFQTHLGKFMPVPWVGYLPDFQHKYLPSNFSEREVIYRDEFYSQMLKDSDGIIVNSLDTKHDIFKFLMQNINNVYSLPFVPFLKNGYEEFLNEDIDKEFEHLIGTKYFMISNQFWKHKNHMLAFKAMKLFYENNTHLSNIRLVCTGDLTDYRDLTYTNELLEYINENSLNNKIILLGLISKKDQIQLLNQCIAVIQPTLFEGGPGGGATYDALSLNKTVILSDIKVNKEINNSNVIFFNSNSVSDLEKAMNKALAMQSVSSSNNQINHEANRLELGTALFNAFDNIRKKGRNISSDIEGEVINYSYFDSRIFQSCRLNEKIVTNDRQGKISSVLLLDKDQNAFYRSVSSGYFYNIFSSQISFDSTNLNIMEQVEEDLFSIPISHYVEKYVLQSVNRSDILYIYADGGHTERLLKNVDFSNYNLKGVISKKNDGGVIGGYPIISYNQNLMQENCYILISSASYEREIYGELMKAKIPCNKILRIYGD
ncbi:glycosyltransferase [Paenibacillus macerans]|uniref:glycosyltransferase n=1 Tax=Paenibacillus macerans TaxID=44252 RepID=UPI00203EF455|nr:glycosyltransferase [Paenibacillus macerans]MCM3701054.1 glycosyltransferase [Paenibacillus macerans]